jgi:hypothetical protein
VRSLSREIPLYLSNLTSTWKQRYRTLSTSTEIFITNMILIPEYTWQLTLSCSLFRTIMRPSLRDDVMFQDNLPCPSLRGKLPERASWGKGQKTAEPGGFKPTSRESKSPANTSNTTLLAHHSHLSPVNRLSHRLTSNCNHVSLHSWSSQRWPVQGRLPKVRSPSKTHSERRMLTETPATTQRMAPSFATSTHAALLPRPSRLRWVPMAATRLSSTTCRK